MTSAAVKARDMSYHRRGKFWTHLVLVIGSFIMIFPFVWMLLTTFKT